jgi:hypothetical protein
MDSTLLVVILVSFLAFWCAICFSASVLGGWHSLARHYRQLRPFGGKLWHFSSGSLGLASYSLFLTLGASPEGLFLAVSFPLRLGHPPLFIPWSEVESIEPHRFLSFPIVRFRFKQAPKVSLVVSRRVALAMAKESNRSLS